MKMNLYSNKKADILKWANVYRQHGYDCKAIERTMMNGRPGQSKYCLTIYCNGRTQADYTAFENAVMAIYRTI